MKLLTLWCCSLFSCVWIQGQSTEFTAEEWARIKLRWQESQPVVKAFTRSGEVVAGQQIHASGDSIYIYPGLGLPVGPHWQKGLVAVDVNEIERVLFQPGGNKLGRKRKAISMVFPPANAAYSEPHVELRNQSVYVDSLYHPPDLETAFGYSDVFNRAYRKKRLRLSFGASFGSDVLKQDILDVLGESDLPMTWDTWGHQANLELLDMAVRVTDRLILGGSLLSRLFYSSASGYYYDELREINYHYNVESREHRVYAEYAILNTDRYFLRKFEVIAGAGMLFSKPDWRFTYRYYNLEDPDNIYGDELYYYHSDRVLGVQLKGALHYYFFPGLSVWSALDLNLNQPFVVPQQELPLPGMEESFLLPEHELGFSGVRFKLGLSIYL